MKVLVIAPNWIGDVLMAQPLFRVIKQDPEVQLTVFAPEWVAPLLEVMPEVDAVLGNQLRHGSVQMHSRLSWARQIRAHGFRRAFVLPNSFKSALIPWLARIPERVGYRGEARSGFLTRVLPNPDPSVPMTHRYLRLGGSDDAESVAPRLAVSPGLVMKTRERFGFTSARPIIFLCPGAEYGPAKRWPARHYAALAELLHEENPDRILVILGSPSDAAVAAEITSNARVPIQDLSGKTSLGDAIALLAGASAVVSNDSGLMHIAAALQRPQVAIFGSTDPRHTPPRSAQAQVLWLHLDCSPCFKRVCPLGHLNCLNQIGPLRVTVALELATRS